MLLWARMPTRREKGETLAAGNVATGPRGSVRCTKPDGNIERNLRMRRLLGPEIRATLLAAAAVLLCAPGEAAESKVLFSGEKKLNNLVSELLEVSSVSKSSQPIAFKRPSD